MCGQKQFLSLEWQGSPEELWTLITGLNIFSIQRPHCLQNQVKMKPTSSTFTNIIILLLIISWQGTCADPSPSHLREPKQVASSPQNSEPES